MNSHVLLIRDRPSVFSDQIISEANPKQKTIIQFCNYNQVITNRDYKQNICIPRIPCLENINPPLSYKLLSHVCVSNNLDQMVLSRHNIQSIKLDFVIKKCPDKLKISNAFDKYYKYGSIINFRQDLLVLEDLIYVFYESQRTLNNSVMLLAIEADDSKQVFSYIDKVHQQLNIKPSNSKLIITVTNSIDDKNRMSIINTIDCLLQINTLFISDFEYYYATLCQKRIIGKYNLDNAFNIETVGYQKKLFKFDNSLNFYHQFDHHDLYTKLASDQPVVVSHTEIEKSTSGIGNICNE